MEHFDSFNYNRGRLCYFISDVVVKNVLKNNPDYLSNGKIKMNYGDNCQYTNVAYARAKKKKNFGIEYEHKYNKRSDNETIAKEFRYSVKSIDKYRNFAIACNSMESTEIIIEDNKEPEQK